MTNVTALAGVAALVGEPARAAIMVSLMDGRALTAGELGAAAGVTPQTASGHLARLMEGGLLALERQGRHRYYRIASASVATLIETVMSLSGELGAAAPPKPIRTGPRDRALRQARLCYDHLAGEVAVGITASMAARGQLHLGQDGGLVTDQGLSFLTLLGVDPGPRPWKPSRHPAFCRPCMDWSERRPHMAGRLGQALYGRFVQTGWMRLAAQGRVVSVTPLGWTELDRYFGLKASGQAS